MPLTTTGKDVLASMKESYGSNKKAKKVFYASMNKGKPGSEKWAREKARRNVVEKAGKE